MADFFIIFKTCSQSSHEQIWRTGLQFGCGFSAKRNQRALLQKGQVLQSRPLKEANYDDLMAAWNSKINQIVLLKGPATLKVGGP